MKDVQRHDIGEVVAMNGRIYDCVDDAQKDGTTAVAMIGALVWESEEVSGKYTSNKHTNSDIEKRYFKCKTAIAIALEDITMLQRPNAFSTEYDNLDASKVDANWVNTHKVTGANWYQMNHWHLQRMLVECGDTNPHGDNNLIYCLDDIKTKLDEFSFDSNPNHLNRTRIGKESEFAKKLKACGGNFIDGNLPRTYWGHMDKISGKNFVNQDCSYQFSSLGEVLFAREAGKAFRFILVW
jgi:hypothetical protein